MSKIPSLAFLFFLGLSFASTAFSEPENDDLAYQYFIQEFQRVVVVKKTSAKRALKRRVEKAGATVVAEGERFLVVRPTPNATREQYRGLIDRLKKDPAVLEVRNDRVVSPLEHDADTKGERSENGDAERSCALFPRCGEANPAWARLQVGADLADEIVAGSIEGTKGEKLARVAVVDSGFDKKNQTNGIEAGTFSTEKGHASAGDENLDPDGHGTAVAGMIAGKGIGITKHVHLKVLRVTESNANGHTTNALIAAAIEKACEDSDVVNVSWGSLFDELGLVRVEDQLWYRKAAEKGCLVIKAAGNSGIKRTDDKPIPAESPFLSVAASDAFNDDASFSTTGSVSGPGEGVYSLLSKQHFYSDATTKRSCLSGGQSVGPVDGTSFAAPLVAGVAAQVITILKARGSDGLEPSRKIKLVKNILQASAVWSQRSGSRRPIVVAATAALIAKTVPLGNPDIEPAELVEATLKDKEIVARCASPIPDCGSQKTCETKKACLQELRYRMFVCLPPSTEVTAKAFDAYTATGEGELLLQLFERIPPKSELQQKAVLEWLRQWRQWTGTDNQDYDRGLNLLASASRGGFYDKIDAPGRFTQLIRSQEFSNRFKFAFPIGTSAGGSGVEQQAAKFTQAFAALSSEDQIGLIKTIPGISGSNSEFDLLYYLNYRNESLKPEVRAAVLQKSKELAEKWFRGDLRLTEVDVVTSLPAFDSLFNALPDGPAALRKILNEPISRQNAHLFGFAVSSPTALGKDRIAFAEKTAMDSKLDSDETAPYLLDQCLKTILKDGSPEAVSGTVRRVLLENPNAVLPNEAIVYYSKNFASANQKTLAGDHFFPLFLQKNVDLLTKQISGDTLSINAPAEVNLRRIFDDNKLFDEDQQREALTGDGGEKLKTLLRIASGKLVKADQLGGYRNASLRGSLDIVGRFLDKSAYFEKIGFKDKLKEALLEVKADFGKNPAKYPIRWKQDIQRLYDLKEIE